MSKNTMIYGLVIAGGLLAYYAWKKQSAKSDASANLASSSGTFVDDVPILKNNGIVETKFNAIKNSVSQIVEPLIGTNTQTETNNVRPYQGFEEITYES